MVACPRRVTLAQCFSTMSTMTQQTHSRLERLFAIDAGARFLGMSERALRARIFRGQIPVVRIGRRVFLDRERLEQWIAEHSVGEIGGLVRIH